ncbi:hypothetical protein ACF0H5_008808 [Mactra antiquata]
MDKKKNFESYAKSLFGKAFGKKKSKNPLANDEETDFTQEPFRLRSDSSASVFTIFGGSPHHPSPDRNSNSLSQVDLVFDSGGDIKPFNLSDDRSNNDQRSKHRSSKDNKKTHRDKNENTIDMPFAFHPTKHSDTGDMDDPFDVSGNKRSRKDKDSKENDIKNKDKKDKDKKDKSKKSKNEKQKDSGLVILGDEQTSKKTPNENTDPKHENVGDRQGTKDQSKSRQHSKTRRKAEPKHGKGRLEKQNSERDSGISLNEGDDSFSFFSDEMNNNKLQKSHRTEHSNSQGIRPESDCDLSSFCVDHMKMCTSRAEVHRHEKSDEGEPGNSSNTVRISPTPSGRITRNKARKITVEESPDPTPGSQTSTAAFKGMVAIHRETLEKLYNYAGIMIQDREDTKEELRIRKEAMEEWIMDYVQEITAIINKLKVRVLPQLENLHEQTTSDISHLVTKLHQIRHESRLVLQGLQVPDDFNDFDKYRSIINNGTTQAHELETQLKDNYDTMEDMYYEFEFSPEIQHLKDTETIASVGTITAIPKLPPFLSNPDEVNEDDDQSQFTSMKSLDSHVNVEGNQSAKSNKYCFTGCAYILSDSFVLTDWLGGTLKMINSYGLVSDSLKFEQNPWDVVQTCSGQVAVTVPRKRSVYFVEAEPHLKISKSFSTGCQCFGICKFGDKFAMTCDPWSRTPSFRIFDQIGNTLLIVDKDSIGENIFKCPLHICSDFFNTVLYVSDSTADCVYALSPIGEILFCYEHCELDYPAGIATDRNNCLYICGRKSANIQKISNTGELCERFVQRRHGVSSPCAIGFHPDGGHVIITDLVGNVSTGFWKARLS